MYILRFADDDGVRLVSRRLHSKRAKCEDLLCHYWGRLDELNKFIHGEQNFSCGCDDVECCIGQFRAYEHCYRLQSIEDQFEFAIAEGRLYDNLVGWRSEPQCWRKTEDKMNFNAICGVTVSYNCLNATRNYKASCAEEEMEEDLAQATGSDDVRTGIADNIDCTTQFFKRISSKTYVFVFCLFIQLFLFLQWFS